MYLLSSPSPCTLPNNSLHPLTNSNPLIPFTLSPHLDANDTLTNMFLSMHHLANVQEMRGKQLRGIEVLARRMAVDEIVVSAEVSPHALVE
jgi:hypothetical protein